MKKIICFDVDGVLIDSRDEIMVSSWNEYNAWLAELGLPHQPFTGRLAEVSPAFFAARTALGDKSHKGYHRVAINPFILAGFDPAGIDADLIARVAEADPKLKASTMARLKTVRDELLQHGNLAQLVKRFDEVDYDWIKARMAVGEVYFITNNAFSIEGLKAYGLTPDPRYVRGPQGQMHDKADHINAICRDEHITPEQLLFIDDSQAALEDVARGSEVPDHNIVQNSWCPKPPVARFERLDWQAIIDRLAQL